MRSFVINMNQMCRCYAWDLNCKQEVRTSSYGNFPDLKESKNYFIMISWQSKNFTIFREICIPWNWNIWSIGSLGKSCKSLKLIRKADLNLTRQVTINKSCSLVINLEGKKKTTPPKITYKAIYTLWMGEILWII